MKRLPYGVPVVGDVTCIWWPGPNDLPEHRAILDRPQANRPRPIPVTCDTCGAVVDLRPGFLVSRFLQQARASDRPHGPDSCPLKELA